MLPHVSARLALRRERSASKVKAATQTRLLTEDKIEVFDSQSDLIANDVEKNEVTNVENDPAEFECFPFWFADVLKGDGKPVQYRSK